MQEQQLYQACFIDLYFLISQSQWGDGKDTTAISSCHLWGGEENKEEVGFVKL